MKEAVLSLSLLPYLLSGQQCKLSPHDNISIVIHLFTADLCIIFIILNSVILYIIPLHHSLTHLTVGVAASFIFRQFDPLWGEQRSNRSQASWPRVNTMGRLDQWYRAENALHIHVVIIRIICFTLWCDRIVTEFLMTGHFKSGHKARTKFSVRGREENCLGGRTDNVLFYYSS